MIRESDIINYLPQYIKEYREIQYITNVENPELQLLIDETEVIKNNQFITTCDEVGIKFFEDLLGIVAIPDESLEYRIARVLLYWYDLTPYTYRVLIEKLTILCGDEGTFILTPNFNEYELGIEIVIDYQLTTQAEELVYLIHYMIPANLVVKAEVRKEYDINKTLTVATATTTNRIQTINIEDKIYNLETCINVGNGVVTNRTNNINL